MVMDVLGKLKSLKERNEKDKAAVNKDLFRILCNRELLVIAYNKIKSKPGNMTPGTDNLTLDGISDTFLDEIIYDLKHHKFSFKPVRRAYIPKGNTDKLRPLGIPSPRDKIVQQAMLYILESIFEPIFYEQSHGFRPGRSCHTALKEIRSKWSGVKWAIEGDIKGCYDNIDHNILVSIIRKKVDDEKFIQLIWKLLRAGIIINNNYVKSKLGAPQGSILSPLLANIYLNELDKFIIENIISLNSSQRRRPNKNYKILDSKINRLNKKLLSSNTLTQEEILETKVLLKILNKDRQQIPSKNPMDPKHLRIRYLRYADDWIIGISGNKNTTQKIKNIIEVYLQENLRLTLSSEKTKITHFPSRKVKFLSYQIQIGKKSQVTSTSNLKRRSAGWQPRLFIPTNDIVNKLKDKKFCKNNKGCRKKGWIMYPDDIITKRYNAILLGIRNYYSPADNFNKGYNRIQYILMYSWAHTLASKHRTNISKQLKRTKELNLKVIKNITNNIWDFKINSEINNPYIGLKVSPLRSKSISTIEKCKICGTKENLEMHHLKALKKDGILIEDKYLAAMMQRMNRKQICVCRTCHINIHKGNYDGDSLKLL
jgi:group II intron reverse transcriptase/maturase